MKINNYELALSEAELDDILNNQTITVELIGPDFPAYAELSEGNKKAFAHLVKAAKLFNKVFLIADHELNWELKAGLEAAAAADSHAAKALRFFNNFNGVEGLNGVAPQPVELFSGVSGRPGRNFYPTDLTVEEFHNLLIKMICNGEVDEVRRILSVRTMVRRDGDRLKAVDFTEFFAKEFSEIANELELAAHYTDDPAFKEYLGWQAQALLQNNPDMDVLADRHWAKLQKSPLEFTIARENYSDELTPTVFDNPQLAELIRKHDIEVNAKDSIGVRVGIVNQKGTDLLLRFKSHIPELARLMPRREQYTQAVCCDCGGDSDHHCHDHAHEIKQTMVDVDLAAFTGDFQAARGGMTVAENLPNNDKPSVKMGGGRRNVYHRQVRQTIDAEKTRKILQELVSPELHEYFDPEAEHLFVIGHENGHSLGPDDSFQSALGSYAHIIEEHKADLISLAFMPEYVKLSIIDASTLRKIYLTHTISGFFLRAKPSLSLPHRVGDLMQFNYLLTHGVISFDENGKLKLDFNAFPDVMRSMLDETIAVQLSKSPEQAKAFVERYAQWGEHSERIAEVHRRLGIKPYKELKTYF